MKVLLFAWRALNEDLLLKNLRKKGYEVEVYNAKCDDYMFDGKIISDMMMIIHSKGIKMVVSYNFLPVVSLVCETCKIDYYSWSYDSPQLSMFAKTAVSEWNHMGLFDRRLTEFFNDIGYKDVYHVPLAVDTEDFDKKLSMGCSKLDKATDKGHTDISFVGSMYTDVRKNNLYDIFRKEAEKENRDLDIWEELDEILAEYRFDYTKDLINDDLTEINEFLKPYMQSHAMGLGDNYFDAEEIIMREAVLEKKITSDERRILMTSIANHCKEKDYKFGLYTTSDTKGLGELDACNRGPVDYEKEMPFVFNRSKINLHITLRSIHTGIPLRVFDVLGCGGFLLSNAQEEILEFFEDGKHLVTYTTPEECIEKIDYYLVHEEERKKIAIAGKEKVRQCFSYEVGLNKLFKI